MDIKEYKKRFFKAIKPVADELRRAGFEIKKDDFSHIKAKNGTIIDMKTAGITVEDDDLELLMQKYNPLPKEAVDILLKWIPKVKYEPAQEVLVSQLSKPKEKYDGNILLDLFKQTNSHLLRERIGFVLSESKPSLDLQELENILWDQEYGETKSTMLITGIKLLVAEKINPILINEFDKYPWFCWDCVKGLQKTGGKKELEFLEKRLVDTKLSKKEKNAIEKAIKSIKNDRS